MPSHEFFNWLSLFQLINTALLLSIWRWLAMVIAARDRRHAALEAKILAAGALPRNGVPAQTTINISSESHAQPAANSPAECEPKDEHRAREGD